MVTSTLKSILKVQQVGSLYINVLQKIFTVQFSSYKIEADPQPVHDVVYTSFKRFIDAKSSKRHILNRQTFVQVGKNVSKLLDEINFIVNLLEARVTTYKNIPVGKITKRTA